MSWTTQCKIDYHTLVEQVAIKEIDPKYFISYVSHTILFVAKIATMYSISIEERSTIACLDHMEP